MRSVQANSFRGFAISVFALGHFFHDVYTSFLPPLLPLLIEKLSLTFASAGFLSVMMRLPSLLSPLIGAAAERINPRYLVVAAPAISAVMMSCIGWAPGYGWLIVLIIITGFSSACFHVPAPVLLKRCAGRHVGAAMSVFQIGGELARTLGPVIVLGAVALWGLGGVVLLIPGGVVMSAALYAAVRSDPGTSSAGSPVMSGSVLKTLRTDVRLFAAVFGLLVGKSFSASVIGTYLPVYLTHTGTSIWKAGGALSLLQAAAITGVFVSGPLSDRIGARKMLVLLSAATPPAMIFFLLTSGWLSLFFLLILGFCGFSSTPVILALIQKREFSAPSVANGIYMTINFMLSSGMIALAGLLSDHLGISTTLRLCAVCSAAGIPFAFLLSVEHGTASAAVSVTYDEKMDE